MVSFLFVDAKLRLRQILLEPSAIFARIQVKIHNHLIIFNNPHKLAYAYGVAFHFKATIN